MKNSYVPLASSRDTNKWPIWCRERTTLEELTTKLKHLTPVFVIFLSKVVFIVHSGHYKINTGVDNKSTLVGTLRKVAQST